MGFREDPRLAEAKAIPISQIVERLDLAGLRRSGAEMTGPCPVCVGKDRFGVNVQNNVFNCRRCEVGGDGIKLVEFVLGMNFRDALSYLCGDADVQLDPAEADRRRRAADKKLHEQEAIAQRKRAGAIGEARKIWQDCVPANGTIVQAYLARRGITLPRLFKLPPTIRFHAALPYMVSADRGWHELHRGPAMVAAIQDAARKVIGVHRTWIDLDQAKGKAVLEHNGKSMPSKKVFGSKKGGSIRLSAAKGATTMVMGEGIETSLTALVANGIPDAAYWCGVDLGNMAGRRKLGQGLKYKGLPDMADDDAWVPPLWVKRLVFIQDGDSDPKLTRAKLESGLRRAMATVPGLKGQIVHAGEGVDLNDVLMGMDVVPYNAIEGNLA